MNGNQAGEERQKIDLQNMRKCGIIGYGWQKGPGRCSKGLYGGAKPGRPDRKVQGIAWEAVKPSEAGVMSPDRETVQIDRKEKRIGQLCQKIRKKGQVR